MTLVSKKMTYELTPQELTTLLAKYLGEKGFASPRQKIDVTYRVADTSDDRFGACSSYDLTKVIITLEDQ